MATMALMRQAKGVIMLIPEKYRVVLVSNDWEDGLGMKHGSHRIVRVEGLIGDSPTSHIKPTPTFSYGNEYTHEEVGKDCFKVIMERMRKFFYNASVFRVVKSPDSTETWVEISAVITDHEIVKGFYRGE